MWYISSHHGYYDQKSYIGLVRWSYGSDCRLNRKSYDSTSPLRKCKVTNTNMKKSGISNFTQKQNQHQLVKKEKITIIVTQK